MIAITRICPQTRESIVIVAHCAFHQGVVDGGHRDFHPIELGGYVNRLLFEIQTVYNCADRPEAHFKRHTNVSSVLFYIVSIFLRFWGLSVHGYSLLLLIK